MKVILVVAVAFRAPISKINRVYRAPEHLANHFPETAKPGIGERFQWFNWRNSRTE
jgi:hypothetical protein